MRIKAGKILQMNELTPGMRVSIENLYTSEKQEGLVLEVEQAKSRMVDGKPVASSQVKKVTIFDERGGENIIITEGNINQYRISRLK